MMGTKKCLLLSCHRYLLYRPSMTSRQIIYLSTNIHLINTSVADSRHLSFKVNINDNYSVIGNDDIRLPITNSGKRDFQIDSLQYI